MASRSLWNQPLSLLNQNFAQGLWDHDLPSPASVICPALNPTYWLAPQRSFRHHHQSAGSGLSEISSTKDKFEVKLDVHQFHPDEVQVRTLDNYVIVEGNHEEKEDQHGFISRSFKRRYLLPENVLADKIVCNLSSDGVLSITVPRKEIEGDAKGKVLPINQTGKPAVSSGCARIESGKAAAAAATANGCPPADAKKN